MEVCGEDQQSFSPSADSQFCSFAFLRKGASQVASLRLAVSGVIEQLHRRVITLQQQCAQREALLNDSLLALHRRASKRRQKGHQGWVSYSRLRSQNEASSVAPPGRLASDQALQKVVAGLQFDWQLGCELLHKMRCKWALAALFGAHQVAQAQRALAEEALWRQKEPLLRPCFWALWRKVLRRRTKRAATARPRTAALSFHRRRTLERFLCQWMAYSSRRIALRAVREAAVERLRRRVLGNGLRGWRAWRKRKVWGRDAVATARERNVQRHLRSCFLGWRSEAGKRRILLERLLWHGARNKGSERVYTAAHNQTSPLWPPKKVSHVAPDSFSHVAADNLSSPKGPLEPGVPHWAVALLQKIECSTGIQTPRSLAGPTSPPDKRKEYGQLCPDIASASAGNICNRQRQKSGTGEKTSDPLTGVFTLKDACEVHHARSLARRALVAWKTECEYAQSAMGFARASGNRSRATRVFRTWLSGFRRRKTSAELHWRAAMIARVFTLWKKRAQQSGLLRERLEAALRGRRHRALSLALWGWREWGVNKRSQQERIAGVEMGIVCRRLEGAFEAWREEAARKGRKRRAVRRGLEAGLGRVWRHWARRAKARVLLRRIFAAAEARWTVAARFPSHHSDFQAALVCFATWRAFTLQRAADRAEAVRTGAADVYNRARLLTKAFQALRCPVDDHRAQKAEQLFRRKVLWGWRKWAERKKDGPTARVLAMFRAAAGGRTVGEYNRGRVLRGLVRVWKQGTEEKRARGEAYRAQKLLEGALTGWVHVRGKSQERVAVHTRRWDRLKLGGILKEWKRVGLQRKEKERRVEVGKRKRGRRLKATGVAAWKAYCESRRQKCSVSLLARQHAAFLLKRRTVRSWLNRLAWRDLKVRAGQLREHRLKRATWRALIRHTRESEVVRDLVTGSRTRGFSVATTLRGSRAKPSPPIFGETPRKGPGALRSGRGTSKSGGETPKAGQGTPKPARGTPNSAPDAPRSHREKTSSRGTRNPAQDTPGRGEPTSGRETPNMATSFSAEQAPRPPPGVLQRSGFAALEEGEKRTRKSEEGVGLPIGMRKRGVSETVGSEFTFLGAEGQGKVGGKFRERFISKARRARLKPAGVAVQVGAMSRGASEVETKRNADEGSAEDEELALTSAMERGPALTSAGVLRAGPLLGAPSTGAAVDGLGEFGDFETRANLAADLGTGESRESGADQLAADFSVGAESVMIESLRMESNSAPVADHEQEVTGEMELSGEEPSEERVSAIGEIATEARDEVTGGNGPRGRSVCGVGKESSWAPVFACHVDADVLPVGSEMLAEKAGRSEGQKRGGGPERRARAETESDMGRTELAGTGRADSGWERSEPGDTGTTGGKAGVKGQKILEGTGGVQTELTGGTSRGRNSGTATERKTGGPGIRRAVSKSTGTLVSVRGGKRPRRLSYVETRVRETASLQGDVLRGGGINVTPGAKSLGSFGSNRSGAGRSSRSGKFLEVLSPRSVGGLSPWGGAESVWSPEGIVTRGGFVPPGSGCPPKRDAPGGCLAGIRCPPEGIDRTKSRGDGKTTLAAVSNEIGPRASQKAAVLGGGGTRSSLTLVGAERPEHRWGVQGQTPKRVSGSVDLGEDVPQEWADGMLGNGKGTAGGAEGPGKRAAAGGLQKGVCDGGRNPGIRGGGMEDGAEGVFCAPGERNLVKLGEMEAGDRSCEATGMDDSRSASARGVGRASISDGHVAASQQFDGQFDVPSNGEKVAEERGNAVRLGRGGNCTVWARPPEQSASPNGNGCENRPTTESFARLEPSPDWHERRSVAEQERASSHRGGGQRALLLADRCEDGQGGENGAADRGPGSGFGKGFGFSLGSIKGFGSSEGFGSGEGFAQPGSNTRSLEKESRAGFVSGERRDAPGEESAGRRASAGVANLSRSVESGEADHRNMHGEPGASTGLKAGLREAGDIPSGWVTEERKSWSLHDWGVRATGNGACKPLPRHVEAERFCEAIAPVRDSPTASVTEGQGRRTEDATSGPAVKKRDRVRWPPERVPRGSTAGLVTGAVKKETAGKTRHGSLVKWPPGAFTGSGSQRISANVVFTPGCESPGSRRRRASAPSRALEAARETLSGPELVRGYRVVEPECALGPKHCTHSIFRGIADLQSGLRPS